MAVLYVVVGILGRLSVIDGSTVALVWPAAGVAFLWLLHQPDRASYWWCLSAEAVLLAAVMRLTGADGVLVLTAVVASAAQTALCVTLLRLWCPGILGTGGPGSVHSTEVVARGTASVLVGTTAGAMVGGIGLGLQSGSLEALDFVSWWMRNFTGIVVIGAVGHLLWERAGSTGGRSSARRHLELSANVVATAAVYGIVFTQSGLPLAFLGVPMTVWAALRFPTVVSAAHAALFGSAATVLTLMGRGPFGDIARPELEAITTQAFLLTSMLTALAIGAGRDERAALAANLAASERAANQRAELLDAMTEAMSEGLAVVDADGEVIRMNAACQDLLALTPQGLRSNSRDYELRRPDGVLLDRTEYPSARAITEGTVAAHDVHLVFRDGSTRILSVRAAALTGGDGQASRIGAMLVYRDVTAERQDRSELAAFASTVAHDLRSPLTAVRGWLDLLGSQVQDLVEAPDAPSAERAADVQGSVARAEKATIRMSDLIQDILSQATAEGQPLDLARVELGGDGGLLHEIMEMVPNSVAFTVGDLPAVTADEDLLRQLLANLVGNAVKYADPQRPARISISGSVVHQRARIEIGDNGVGVPAEHRDRVFEKFHRAHAGDRRFTGTGLGLALSRTIVERHGGTIECRPGPDGTGTTMRFDLALAGAEPDRQGTADVSAPVPVESSP